MVDVLKDAVAMRRLMESVRSRAMQVFVARSIPDAQVRDTIVDAVLLARHFGAGEQIANESLIQWYAYLLLESMSLGAVANLMDTMAWTRNNRVSNVLAEPSMVGPVREIFRQAAERCDWPWIELLQYVNFGGSAKDQQGRASLLEMSHDDYCAQLSKLRHGIAQYLPMGNAAVNAPLPDDAVVVRSLGATSRTHANSVFKIGVASESLFDERLLHLVAGSSSVTASPDEVMQACTDAIDRVAAVPPGATVNPAEIRPVLIRESEVPMRSQDILDRRARYAQPLGRGLHQAVDLLHIVRERRRLFGEPLALRYGHGMTSMTYVMSMLRRVPGHLRIATIDAKVVGFISVIPLTRVGLADLVDGKCGVFGLMTQDRVEGRPGKAASLLVQNFINSNEGTSAFLTTMRRLMALVEDAVAEFVDPAPRDRDGLERREFSKSHDGATQELALQDAPHVVATGANKRGQGVLEADKFEVLATTPYGTSIYGMYLSDARIGRMHALADARRGGI